MHESVLVRTVLWLSASTWIEITPAFLRVLLRYLTSLCPFSCCFRSAFTGNVKTLAFANFSEAMLPAGAGSRASSPSPELAGVGAGARAGGLYSRAGSSRPGSPMASIEAGAISGSGSGSLYECSTRVIDYSKQKLSVSTDARIELGRRVGAVASCMERAFGGAQDVEGCLVGEELYVVQTRPQP